LGVRLRTGSVRIGREHDPARTRCKFGPAQLAPIGCVRVRVQTSVALALLTATREEALCMIEVRPAHQGDAPKVRALLGLLGYDVPLRMCAYA
jgi:hypothetical protein